MATFVNADAGEIALTRSTTEGMNLFTHGLDWKAGDEVIYNTHEHGGGIGPYTTLTKRLGIKVVTVDIPAPPQSIDHIVGLYEKAITPRTKVIMVDVPSVLGMTAAIDMQNAIGKRNIEARVRALSTRLRAGLKTIPGVKMWTSEDPAFAAGLTLFSVRDIPMANVQQAILNRDRIYIRTMTTGNLNAVRAATHIYNMPDEVDRLIASVKHVSENATRYMTMTAAAR